MATKTRNVQRLPIADALGLKDDENRVLMAYVYVAEAIKLLRSLPKDYDVGGYPADGVERDLDSDGMMALRAEATYLFERQNSKQLNALVAIDATFVTAKPGKGAGKDV